MEEKRGRGGKEEKMGDGGKGKREWRPMISHKSHWPLQPWPPANSLALAGIPNCSVLVTVSAHVCKIHACSAIRIHVCEYMEGYRCVQICDVVKAFILVHVCSEYTGSAYQRASTHEFGYKEESTAHNQCGGLDRERLTVKHITTRYPENCCNNNCWYSEYLPLFHIFRVFKSRNISKLCKFILSQSTPFLRQ